MAPKDIKVLIPGICEYHFIWEEELCRYKSVEDCEMGRLARIIQVVPKCNHKSPLKRETKRDLTTETEISGITDAESKILCC